MRRSSRRSERGAIFVEATIIVSSFTLLLLSMVFFKNMYIKQITTMRLARATILAHSMQGCPEGGDPGAWASIDLDPKAGKNLPPPTNNKNVKPPGTPALGSQRATKIMSELPGAGSDGST